MAEPLRVAYLGYPFSILFQNHNYVRRRIRGIKHRNVSNSSPSLLLAIAITLILALSCLSNTKVSRKQKKEMMDGQGGGTRIRLSILEVACVYLSQ
jgi:hypothetical protein